jgi:hypothetical protein
VIVLLSTTTFVAPGVNTGSGVQLARMGAESAWGPLCERSAASRHQTIDVQIPEVRILVEPSGVGDDLCVVGEHDDVMSSAAAIDNRGNGGSWGST